MISFIILNYNTPDFTATCVDSIEQHYGCIEHEIIVVDNNSSAANFKQLTSLVGDRTIIVRSHVNAGFGLGNMMGAQQAAGEYLCFLNSDVVLVEDCVTPLIAYLKEHSEVGVITAQQWRTNGQEAFSFRHKMGIRRDLLGDDIFEWLCPKKYPKRSNLSRTQPFVVSEINGSFMLFPTDVFWQIGGFDTNIFLYHEEYDIGRRIELYGLS